VEVGLTPNFMKGIHIFPLSIVGSFFNFFFYQVNWMCNVWSYPFKLMFNKYNKQCKVGEGHFNSYFYKKIIIYKVCNDSKSNVCFNIVVGVGN